MRGGCLGCYYYVSSIPRSPQGNGFADASTGASDEQSFARQTTTDEDTQIIIELKFKFNLIENT